LTSGIPVPPQQRAARLPVQLAIPIWQLVLRSAETQPSSMARAVEGQQCDAETLNTITSNEWYTVEAAFEGRAVVVTSKRWCFQKASCARARLRYTHCSRAVRIPVTRGWRAVFTSVPQILALMSYTAIAARRGV
jgi:hypothetical protein